MSTREEGGSCSLACPQACCGPRVGSRRGVSALLDPHWLRCFVHLGV